MQYLKKYTSVGAAVIISLFFMSCAGTPDKNPMLEKAQTAYRQAENDTLIVKNASVALDKAGDAVTNAQLAFKKGKDKATIDHEAYMAQQRVKIARQTAMLNAAQDEVKQAKSQRQQVLIEARKAEAEASERQAKLARQQANKQMAQAKSEREAAMAAQQKAKKLSRRIKELQAERTARGLVLTLGNVLFDVDKTDLKPGGRQAVQKLASFLNDYPKRKVMIEGYTDNTGSEQYNQKLSLRRANSVRQALLNDGIANSRIQVHGYGEQYPVATNSTAAGRQQNRRIEVVISDKNGNIKTRQK